MDLKNNEMTRNVTQAMYKYLPGAWIDFHVKNTRSTFAAKVIGWNSELLIGINETRLLEKIKMNIEAFEVAGGETDGFGETAKIDTNNYEIRTPKLGVNPDIITEVSPLTFYCSKCNKVERLRSTGDVSKERVLLSKCCKKPLKQIALIYTCECGWAGPVETVPCKQHGFDNMRYNGKFGFTCMECNRPTEMVKWCPKCGAKLFPRTSLDGGNFMPFSISTIDLINMREEEFLQREKEVGAKVILAKWLGELGEEQYRNFILNGIGNEEDEALKLQYQNFLDVLKNSGMPLEQAESMARQAVYKSGQNLLSKIDEYFNIYINTGNSEKLNQYAASILEYYRILNGEDGIAHISTIEDAKRIAKQLGTSTEYDRYDEIISNLGIKNIQVCNNVPFVFSTYGYTRRSNDPKGNKKSGVGKVALQAFPREGKDKNTVYAIKLSTEGILIEFDRVKILKWLKNNKFINENDLPVDMGNEKALKEWFINKIDPSIIGTFSPIDKLQSSETFYVYNLLHSMSHALIKQAGDMCGLDKNSLSEYIFPQVPAIFIYCQNSQGLSLGALYNLFEAYLDKWLQFAVRSMEKCIFDPICLDRDKACAGCLYLNEVSCVHFNKDLDRSLLIGHYDKVTEKRIYGFWEGSI